MDPTFAQRLGVRPLQLPADQRRLLFAARAASLCFAVQALLAFAAAAAAGDLGLAGVVAVVASTTLGVLIICRYDQLPRSVNRLFALAATLIVALLTIEQPSGERYALLYVGVVAYVTFFFKRKQALMQLGIAVALWAAVLVSDQVVARGRGDLDPWRWNARRDGRRHARDARQPDRRGPACESPPQGARRLLPERAGRVRVPGRGSPARPRQRAAGGDGRRAGREARRQDACGSSRRISPTRSNRCCTQVLETRRGGHEPGAREPGRDAAVPRQLLRDRRTGRHTGDRRDRDRGHASEGRRTAARGDKSTVDESSPRPTS